MHKCTIVFRVRVSCDFNKTRSRASRAFVRLVITKSFRCGMSTSAPGCDWLVVAVSTVITLTTDPRTRLTQSIKPTELPPIHFLNEQQQQHHRHHIVALNPTGKYLCNDLETIQVSPILRQRLIVQCNQSISLHQKRYRSQIYASRWHSS